MLPLNGGMESQRYIDSAGLDGTWKLIFTREAGKDVKPAIEESITIAGCKSIEHNSGGKVVSKENFTLYRFRDAPADYEFKYDHKDSIGCIKLSIHLRPKGDTLIFSDCGDFESTQYFFKKI